MDPKCHSLHLVVVTVVGEVGGDAPGHMREEVGEGGGALQILINSLEICSVIKMNACSSFLINFNIFKYYF